MGQIYYFSREYEKAAEDCLKALEIYPDFIFAYEYLDDVYLKTGDFGKAVEGALAAEKISNAFAYKTAERKPFLTQILGRISINCNTN